MLFRSSDRDPLDVVITTSNTTQMTGPVRVTIPAGAAATSFTVNAIDDEIPEPDTPIPVTASAPGYIESATTIVIEKSDIPTIAFSVDRATIAENTAPNTVFGVIQRSVPSPLPRLPCPCSRTDAGQAEPRRGEPRSGEMKERRKAHESPRERPTAGLPGVPIPKRCRAAPGPVKPARYDCCGAKMLGSCAPRRTPPRRALWQSRGQPEPFQVLDR